ncbi:hypothetical protein L1049_013990 [Liquidambar formosana]|uniref:Uncharacterized protein n=1 Tax=Liquidambar formosana TaxID=63359 RepID=A0AAP0RLC5_LIQFO
MNPLTLVKRIQNINSKEAALGISEEASWHAKYKESAYVFVGGIPFDLSEGDLIAVFSQYGEIVDVNLVRDKGTGKSKGFAFIAYEDQRSTNLAVDNLNGAQILGRIIRVDHVTNYKKKEEEDEEAEQQKREARGVCRAFQRGECNRGAGCKFSHDEQRAANTGWGRPEDKSWGHDKFEGPTKRERKSAVPEPTIRESFRSDDKDTRRLSDKNARSPNKKGYERGIESHRKRSESNMRDQDSRGLEKQSEWKEKEKEMNYKEDRDRREIEKRSARHEIKPTLRDDDWKEDKRRSARHEIEPTLRDDDWKEEKRRSAKHELEPTLRDDDRKEEKRSRRNGSESYTGEDRDKRGDRWSAHSRDYSSHHQRGRDEDCRRKSDR